MTIKIEVKGVTPEYGDEASTEITLQFNGDVDVEAIAKLAARRAYDDAIAIGGVGIPQG